ncbi:MAG: extradiol ring-cleavage dioxygenase [Alphaproteobacteria bacterium]|nr:extradiol ring-cleavage dioxygenase [Alphaproteobacteria bacterium]MBV9017026.1 extradiol ring-cleavage dioxygenase [Alphaproteobacteria bacterium]MBV9150668.1 extradiol ring-cleavage dioxygenase [Alphaproteobacteria bacterium]MBV9584722.1 extradiol ring-cleavage dioxygenase [Alphaproteobacteria bacterium]
MLNAPPEDWPRFYERDSKRTNLLDTEGRLTSYEEQLKHAPPGIAQEITPERMRARHQAVEGAMARLGDFLREAKLDALIVVGDDQDELYHADNMPGMIVYYGDTIANVPLKPVANPDWGWRAAARWYEEKEPRRYPVDAALARHLIDTLIEDEFDIAASDGTPEGEGEGHAIGFVHKRIMKDVVPIVPVCINTYYPPNQPTPRRCYKLGQAIRAAVESYPGDKRVGIVGSGGLSHFVVDETLDRGFIDMLRHKDAAAIQALPGEKLNSGSSEIRNWICVAGAVEHLSLEWSLYEPGYRTPAGTGTGLGFAFWS